MDAMIEEAREKNRKLALEMKKTKNNNHNDNQIAENDNNVNEKRTRNEILFPDNRDIDPYDPTTYGYIELGTILGAHGVKGEVKLNAVTDFPERLCRPGLRHVKMPNRRSPRRIELLEGRHRMDREYLIRFEGISDREAASQMRGFVLYAREEERPQELSGDEYIVNDLVGLEVFMEDGYKDEHGQDQSGRFVGTVNGVVLAEEMSSIPGLGQDLIEISLPRGTGATPSWRDELVLIPFVPQLVPTVDIPNRSIFIAPPFGLLDLKYVREEKVRIKGFLPPGRD
jgi:16S rRNA processing protein RimM